MEADVLLGHHLALAPISPLPSASKGAIQNQGQEGNCPAVLSPFLGTWNSCSTEGQGSSGLRWQITLNRPMLQSSVPAISLITAFHEELYLEFLPSNALQKQLCPGEAQL